MEEEHDIDNEHSDQDDINVGATDATGERQSARAKKLAQSKLRKATLPPLDADSIMWNDTPGREEAAHFQLFQMAKVDIVILSDPRS